MLLISYLKRTFEKHIAELYFNI